MYNPVDPKVSFPHMEKCILTFWKENNIFQKSISNREGAEEFVFYDGPPFATGLPHFGHFVPGTLKDIVPRYQTMKGRKVERRFGWDCHGLPVEYEMEKELGISSKHEIETYGISKFNESCRSIVLRYTGEWRNIITRLGRWVDFDNDYKTMEPGYMESIWWVVKQLWEKKLLYEGHYILPYCPRCSTVLSNHELNLGGYKEIHDPAITVRFKVEGQANTYIIAWTTTPWTLPSNLALAAGPDIEYVKIKDGSDFYIMAAERTGVYYRENDDYEIVETMKGRDLEGIEYTPLFPYFEDAKASGAFRVFPADFVSTEDGTGIVHIAPGFGEDDYNVLKKTDIPVVCPVDDEGRFTSEVSDYEGVFVKDADKAIVKQLRSEGKLVKREQYLHNYPHCWRCKSPLIYRAISSWFVKVEEIKDRMVKHNKTIYWMPEHLRDGRFGKWLENACDWAISRNRFWGNPIPIWRCDDCEEMICIGSFGELEEKSGRRPDDLHKHFVDDITFDCSCGGTMKRVPEVLDCWFESGSMPYAQVHYPMENKQWFEDNFPADFICEGLDQTRGWFYTLTVLAAALFDGPAFTSVVVNGLVLAEDGKKMSKSERNYTDPGVVMDQFGADALRLFLMNSAVTRGEDLKYSDEGVREVLKNIIIPIWNAYSFFVTYANIDNEQPVKAPANPVNPLDKWILSEAEHLVSMVTEHFDKYDMQKAIEPIVNFIDLLNNWYIRRSRRRFWRSENDIDKKQAYESLYSVIRKLITVAAPFIPFITEEIYRNIKIEGDAESIHLNDYPVTNESLRDRSLELKMDVTRRAVSLGRALRSMHSIKIRQPLKVIHLVTRDNDEKKVLREMEDIITEELNVKEVMFRENEEELVEYQCKANYKVLGKQLGKDMKQAASKIALLTSQEIQSLMEGATLSIEVSDNDIDITFGDIVVQRNEKAGLKVINEGSLTVALDPEITDELRMEGVVRDLVRGIQNIRKETELDVTDRIVLSLHGNKEVKEAVEAYQDHLMSETLSTSWEWRENPQALDVECGDKVCRVAVEKAN